MWKQQTDKIFHEAIYHTESVM